VRAGANRHLPFGTSVRNTTCNVKAHVLQSERINHSSVNSKPCFRRNSIRLARLIMADFHGLPQLQCQIEGSIMLKHPLIGRLLEIDVNQGHINTVLLSLLSGRERGLRL
jgi:hypothetical protein